MRSIVLLIVGAFTAAIIGVGGWLVRADHDDLKGTAEAALTLSNTNKEQIAVLRVEVEALNAGQRAIASGQETIIRNQVQILKEIAAFRKERIR